MKKFLLIAVVLFATMFATAQTVYQNEWITVDVNDTALGTVTVVNPIVSYDTIVDSASNVTIDTIRRYDQWMFIASEKDSTSRFLYWVVDIYDNDTLVTDTVVDIFYFLDMSEGYDSVALHANFYDVTLGIPDVMDGDTFSIYPNPTGSILYFNRMINTPVYVYNADGRVVMTVVNTNRIDVSGLPNGMYIVRTKSYACRVLKITN